MPLRYTDGREWRKGIPQEEPMSERISDNEWAAGVMRLHATTQPGWYRDTLGGPKKPRAFDKCADDFRDLLNCEAVRAWAAKNNRLDVIRDCWIHALSMFWKNPGFDPDQPAALRRLREAVEGEA